MTEKSSYVSCIKINGLPILPPVITPERRRELAQLKQQAIQLEKHLKNRKALTNDLKELLTYRSLAESSSEISNETLVDLPDFDHLTRLTNHEKLVKTMNLTSDTIDVTQYNSDGIKIIKNNPFSDEYEQVTTIIHYDSNESVGSPQKLTPKPRLIRSNSYTLDTPSPILLAHMERQSDSNESDGKELLKRLSGERNWSSLDNNYIPFDKLDFKTADLGNSTSSTSTPKSTKTDNPPKRVESPTFEVIQTDVTVQQITVNTHFSDEKPLDLRDDSHLVQNPLHLADVDAQLLHILQKLPGNYSQQIVDLIQRQKLEQQETMQNFVKLKEQLLDEGKDLPPLHLGAKFVTKPAQVSQRSRSFSQQSEPNNDSTISMSSQSMHYTFSDNSLETVISPGVESVRLIDLEGDDEGARNSSGKCESSARRNEYFVQNVDGSLDVSRELFPQISAAKMKYLQQEWAASVIGAYVKGYLVRRLLKTERVQTLIETIKDALMCALQLHTADNIDESDVELHRRLIQQVSAACCSFHDIFFSLSIPDQMLMISGDRQRKIDKANRPASAPSARISTSRRSRISGGPIAQSQSLTKV